MLTRPLTQPLTGPLVRGVGEGGCPGGFRGLMRQSVFSAPILPMGTTAINEAAPPTGGSATSSVDSTVTFNGKPTTRVTISGSPTQAFFSIGVNTASIQLSADAQDLLNRKILIAVKSDGANAIDQILLYLGDGTYANFRTFGETVHDSLGGWTLFERIKTAADSVTGSPALNTAQRSKLRVYATSNIVPGSFWVAFVGVEPKPSPVVVFTCDDGYDEWEWLSQQAALRNVPISFGINSGAIGTAGFLTTTQIQSIAANPLFEFTNHSTDNTSYTTAGLSTYVANVEACKAYLTGLGLDPYAASCHQYVQGFFDNPLIDQLKSLGYHSARTVGPNTGQSAQNGLIGLGAGYAMHSIKAGANLDSAFTLTQVQGYLETAAAVGTAFIMGHKFEATAGAITWVNGYDATYGVLDLLDWLADKRDNHGWRLMRWSDWVKQMQTGAPHITA